MSFERPHLFASSRALSIGNAMRLPNRDQLWVLWKNDPLRSTEDLIRIWDIVNIIYARLFEPWFF